MKVHLKEIRTKKGFNQSEFARLCETSRQTIHAIEAGNLKPTILLALKIAQILEVTISEIFILEKKDWK